MAKDETKTEEKKLTVIDDMDQRRLFDSADEATAYINKCQTDYADFGSYPVAAVGLTEEGDFDAEVYTADMRIGVYVLTKRGDGPNSTTVHCIVIAPAPKVAAFLGVDASTLVAGPGLDWLTGIIDKEINHVTVRQLRKAENAQEIAEAVESMPTTLADFITSGRESTSGILETFNTLWQIIKKGVGAKSKPFALANLSKKELRKAMESASYAATVYPQLETRTNKKGEPESLFVLAATFGQLLAKQESLDSTIFDRMIQNRNEKTIEVSDDEEEFDLEAMAASLVKTSEEKPADEGEGQGEDSQGEDEGADGEGEG
ncbi:MAG: hypothetical protein ACRCZI_09750 [Cetobacterium sp.]